MNNDREVIELFETLKGTTSTLEKKRIITENKDNELFKEYLKFLLDTNVVTGIDLKKINKDLGTCKGTVFNSLIEVIDYLKAHNTGRDEDIIKVQTFIKTQPEDCHEFYKEIVTKKYKLGCNKKIVNDCIPNLISTFDLMLGTPIEKVKLKGDEYIYISRKLNGSRCAYVNGKLMTRQGKEYTGLEHIINDIKALGLDNMFIDGELVYKNPEGLTDSESFQKGVGLAMSKDTDKSQLKLVIFDMFPVSQFTDIKQSVDTYSERKHKYLDNFTNPTENLEVVEMFYEGTDHSEIWKWLEYAEENDYEGCMINLDTIYECKRTKNLIKVKRFFTKDLRCIGLNIATSGKYKGTLGSITCKYGEDEVDVGSGFSDYDRDYYMHNQNEILDHIIEIRYKEETKNKNGGRSLQFPTFISCRKDKDIADDEL